MSIGATERFALKTIISMVGTQSESLARQTAMNYFNMGQLKEHDLPIIDTAFERLAAGTVLTQSEAISAAEDAADKESAAAQSAEQGATVEVFTDEQLDSMTVAELKALAAERGVSTTGCSLKADYVLAILGAQE